MVIDYHADDFGLFPSQTACMKQLIAAGQLNSVSVMPNGLLTEENVRFLQEYRETLLVSVHLDFFEGECCGGKQSVSELVDGSGNLSCGFGRLLLLSLLPRFSGKRRRVKEQLKIEIAAQISKIAALDVSPKGLRLDGHAHFHCLPIVFEAIAEVVNAEKLPVSFFRIPKDELRFYRGIAHPLINRVKTLLLNWMIGRDYAYAKRLGGSMAEVLEAMRSHTFFGVMLSGQMCYADVKKLLENAEELLPDDAQVELLFHPGETLRPGELESLTAQDDRHFWESPNRIAEADAIRRLHTYSK